MEFIRPISILKYQTISCRFSSDTFKPNGKGISIFAKNCAMQSSGSICNHISLYYQSTVKQPPLFCIIDSVYLLTQIGFEEAKIEPTDGGNGDLCHYDVFDSKRKGQESFAKDFFKPNNIYKCINGNSSLVSNDELSFFYNSYINKIQQDINNNLF